jgi:hypothetical protein
MKARPRSDRTEVLFVNVLLWKLTQRSNQNAHGKRDVHFSCIAFVGGRLPLRLLRAAVWPVLTPKGGVTWIPARQLLQHARVPFESQPKVVGAAM